MEIVKDVNPVKCTLLFMRRGFGITLKIKGSSMAGGGLKFFIITVSCVLLLPTFPSPGIFLSG